MPKPDERKFIDWNLLDETRFSATYNLILARSSSDGLKIYEAKEPFLLKETQGFMQGAASSLNKVPMMFVAVGAVALYQLFLKSDAPFCKRKDRSADEDMANQSKGRRLMSEFTQEARRKGKMTPKMEKDIAKISSMLDGMDDMGQAYGSQLGKLDKKRK